MARPIGGAIIGHYGDRLGRKTMLVATMIAMGLGTFLIGCLPTYSQIGVWAPILLVILRFIQGIGLGGEWSGAVVMVASTPANRRGFYGSLVQIGFPVGVAASTGIFGLMTQLPEADFLSWGWRVPFLISILLVGVGFIVRLKLAETPHFKEVVERKEVLAQPVLEVLRRDWRSFLLAIGITVSEVGLAYLLTVFTVVYATTKLGLPRQVILNAVVYAALVEFATLPLAGWLSDIFGRRALYLAGGVFSVALAFPLFWFLDTREPALITFALVVTMTLTHALLFGPKAAFMPELFRTQVRYSGASLGANVAAALERRLLAADRDRAARMGRLLLAGVGLHHRAVDHHDHRDADGAGDGARRAEDREGRHRQAGFAASGNARKVMVAGASRIAPAVRARGSSRGSSSSRSAASVLPFSCTVALCQPRRMQRVAFGGQR